MGNPIIMRMLGTAKLGNLSQKNASKLLSTLSDNLVEQIDTAPSYPKSEYRIGGYMRCNPSSGLKIFTKFGRENQTLTRAILRDSLGLSLRRLKVNEIYGLSVHNRRESEISEEVFEEVLYLKDSGLISKFGWCGDWDRIPSKTLQLYDFVMLAVNPYIPEVTQNLKKINIPIIAMNPFANFFWNYKRWGRFEKIYNEHLLKRFNPYPSKYLGQVLETKKSIKELLEFVLRKEDLTSICFGSTSLSHVEEICRIIDQYEKHADFKIEKPDINSF